MTDIEARIDELYGGDPGEFVALRDALARELRGAGDREAAATVAKLRRPTVVAWAVNQVGREHPTDLDELLASGEAVADAQAEAVGGGGAAALRDAMRERRDVVRRLAGAAVRLLDERGGGGETHRDEIVATLEAASLDPEAADLVRRGRLTKELPAPSGFGGAGDAAALFAPAPSTRKAPAKKKAAAAKAAPAKKPDEPKKPTKKQIDAATSAHRRASQRAERAAAAAEDARREADRAAAQVTRLEGELAAARDRATQLAEAAVAAEEDAATAQDAAAATEAELASLGGD